MKKFTFLLLGAIVFVTRSYGSIRIPIDPYSQNTIPSLGQGYSSKHDSFSGKMKCAQGIEEFVGQQVGTVSLLQEISQDRLSSELGFGAGGKGQIGIYKVKAALDFMKSSKSNAYSVSQVYMANYVFKRKQFQENPKIHTDAKAFINNSDEFEQRCGDKFVSQVELGAKLFISIRFDFSSLEEKENFKLDLSIGTAMFEAKTNLATAVQKYSQNTSVKVSLLQIGGDPSKLTEVFSGNNGVSNSNISGFVDCSNGSLNQCFGVLKQALIYATDTKTGFPSQIDPNSPSGNAAGPATLAVHVEPYSKTGHHFHRTDQTKALREMSRQTISKLFSEDFEKYGQVEGILSNKSIKLSKRQWNTLNELSAKLKHNLDASAAASEQCYINPDICSSLINRLKAEATPVTVSSGWGISSWWQHLKSYGYGSKSLSEEDPAVSQIPPLVPVDGDAILAASKATNFFEGCLTAIGDQNPDSKQNTTVTSLIYLVESEQPGFVDLDATDEQKCSNLSRFYEKQIRLDLSSREVEFPAHSGKKKILKFPDITLISFLGQLEEIDLRGNQLDNIDQLGKLKNLRHLDLSHNRIIRIDGLTGLDKILSLNLSYNQISDLRPIKDIETLKYLTVLQNAGKALQCPFEDKTRCFLSDYKGEFYPLTNINCADIMCHFISSSFGNNRALLVSRQNKKGYIIYDDNTQSYSTFPLDRSFDDLLLLSNGNVFLFSDNDDGRKTGLINKDGSFSPIPYDSNYFWNQPNAISLLDGRVLLTGISIPDQTEVGKNAAEIFDPKLLSEGKNPYTAIVPGMNYPRGFHSTVVFTEGRLKGQVLITGGLSLDANKPVGTSELFDPITHSFNKIGSLKIPRSSHASILLKSGPHQGKVLIFGGLSYEKSDLSKSRRPFFPIDSVELFDPETKTFTLLNENMLTPRANLSVTVLEGSQNKGILIVGGSPNWEIVEGGKHAVARQHEAVEIFDPISMRFILLNTKCKRGSNVKMVQFENRKIFVAGGPNDLNLPNYICDNFEYEF